MIEPDNKDDSHSSLGQKAIGAFILRVLVLLLFVILAIFLWRSVQAFLLLFAGFILAMLFSGGGTQIARYTPLPYCAGMMITGVTVIGFLVGGGLVLGPQLTTELEAALEATPQIIANVEKTRVAELLIEKSESSDDSGVDEKEIKIPTASIFSGVISMTKAFFGAIAATILVVALGFFLAWDPGANQRGLLSVLPQRQRKRGKEVLSACGRGMQGWLKGQLFAMVIVGSLTTSGLFLIGYPYPWLGGLIAGILQFIPYIGPFLAMAPVVLLGSSASPTMAFYSLCVMIGVQVLEGNTVTPLVFRQQVNLPPVITLIGTVTAGMVFGPVGLVVGTPLTLIMLILYRMLYQHDVLGDDVEIPGHHS